MKHFAFALLVFTIFNSYSQTDKFSNKGYIETTAVVDSLVVPDRIYLSILIKEKDTRGKQSVEALELKMEAKLNSLGINIAKQLSLSDLSTNFKKYFLRKKDVLKDKSYSLIVHDATTAGKVIVGLESIGISNVYLTKTEYSKIEELKMQLKRLAVIKAKKQSEMMVEPLGQAIGNAIYISDYNSKVAELLRGKASGLYNQEVPSFYVVTALGVNRVSTNIEFEKIKIETGVTIQFKIE